MKKIFALFAALMISAIAFSQIETGEITIVSNQNGIVEFTWDTEGVVSCAYTIAIEEQGEATRDNLYRITDVTVYTEDILAEGYRDVFTYSTDQIIMNGENEFTVKRNTRFLEGAWDEHVNEEDGTLNPGEYLLVISGLDEEWSQEYETRIAFTITADVATSVENITEARKAIKKIVNGVIYIEINGVICNINGF